ncbi:cholesterol esterase [Streptomyces fumigatiscleroticus]|nr:cholesterol esterase [Streptomyces fumigatiscleroticus]
MASSTGNSPDGPESTSPAEAPQTPARRGRVRLRRAAVMAVPATAITAGLAILTAQGALGVQFAISGMPFVVTAEELRGEGFAQYGGLDNMAEDSPNAGDTGGQVLVVTSVVDKATLDGLCQSVDLGGTNLLLKAGWGADKVTASHLTTDSTQLSGSGEFGNIEIGNDASTLDKVDQKGPKGVFSQQADTVVIKDLRQENYAATAAVFKLPGLKMSFSESGCP